MKKRTWFFLAATVFVAASVLGVNRLLLQWGMSRTVQQGSPLVAATEDPRELVPFVPTAMDVAERMLQLADVKEGDVVYDLGSGDGRIVIMAAKKFGARGVGFEIDAKLVEKSRESARSEGVAHLVEFREQDLATADLSRATVVTMYLLPGVNMLLRPKLWRELRPGARIVSHDFDMGDWKPDKVEDVPGLTESATLYLWRMTGLEAGRDFR